MSDDFTDDTPEFDPDKALDDAEHEARDRLMASYNKNIKSIEDPAERETTFHMWVILELANLRASVISSHDFTEYQFGSDRKLLKAIVEHLNL